MILRIADPTRVLVDREVSYVQAEDRSGRFGILPGHEPYLSALVPSILIYRYKEGMGERNPQEPQYPVRAFISLDALDVPDAGCRMAAPDGV